MFFLNFSFEICFPFRGVEGQLNKVDESILGLGDVVEGGDLHVPKERNHLQLKEHLNKETTSHANSL